MVRSRVCDGHAVPLIGRKLGMPGVLVIALLGGSALASGKVRPLTKAQMRACLGMTRQVNHVAKAAPANPSVLGAFRAFAATSATPVTLSGMPALGNVGVATYDPAHAVDLADPSPSSLRVQPRHDDHGQSPSQPGGDPVFALPGYGPGIPDRYKLRVFRAWFPKPYPSKITLLRPIAHRSLNGAGPRSSSMNSRPSISSGWISEI